MGHQDWSLIGASERVTEGWGFRTRVWTEAQLLSSAMSRCEGWQEEAYTLGPSGALSVRDGGLWLDPSLCSGPSVLLSQGSSVCVCVCVFHFCYTF